RADMARGLAGPRELDLVFRESFRWCRPTGGWRSKHALEVERQPRERGERRARRVHEVHGKLLRNHARVVRLGDRPRAREERARRRRTRRAVVLALGAGEEVQAILGPRRRDVEQARGLEILGFDLEVAQIAVREILLRTAFSHRGEKHSARTLSEQEKRRIAPARTLVEARHDDGAELEALRLVDRHDLQVVVGGLQVGQRVKLVQALVERGEVLELARALEALQLVEVDLGVLEVGRARDAGRAAKREPDALDSLSKAPAPAVRDCFTEDPAEALQLFVFLDELPHRGMAILGRNLVEIPEG